jgi:hypothetical protein
MFNAHVVFFLGSGYSLSEFQIVTNYTFEIPYKSVAFGSIIF